MTFLENNTKILERVNPSLMESVRASSDEDGRHLEVLRTKSAYPTLRIRKNGHEILMHSSYDPVNEAERFVSSFNIGTETRLVIILGIGFGYHVYEVLRKLPSHAHLILIEKDENILTKAVRYVDFSFLDDPRVSLFYGDFNPEKLRHGIYPLFFPKIPDEKDIIIVRHFSSMQVYTEYYKLWLEKIKDFISQLAVLANTHIFVSTQWSENTLKNIHELLKNPPIKLLFGKNQGKPAVVVSAGPSLDKNIELLKEVQDKALIIAVGTSLKPLLKRGIKPHLLVAIDGNVRHYEHFRGVALPDDVPLVCDGMTFPRILKEYPGKKYICDITESPVKFWLYSHIGQRGVLPSGFSVATVAFTLAYEMGSSPIILIGQDLSFRTDGHTHAEGTTFQNDVLDFNNHESIFVKVPGNIEESVYTSHVFLSTLRWFENAIQETGVLCVNATEGGAKMNGVHVMSLREAIQRYCKEEIPLSYIHENLKESVPAEDVLQKILGDIEKGIKGVMSIREKSKIGARKSQELHDELINQGDENSKKFQKKARGVELLIEELKANREAFFLDPWMQEVYVYLQKTQDGITELKEYSKTMQEINRAGVFFEGLHRAAKEVLPLLEGARRKTKRVYSEFYGVDNEKKLTILTFNGTERSMMLKYIHEDCLSAFNHLGHNVLRMDLADTDKSCLDTQYLKKISDNDPHVIFTMDNQGLHPMLIEEVRFPVLNFCMDDPHIKNSKEWVRENYFLFATEIDDISELKDKGFPHVHQLLIGGNPERFLRKKETQINEKYKCEVSFVALSLSDSFSVSVDVPDDIRGVFDQLLEKITNDLSLTLKDAIKSLGLTKDFVYDDQSILEKILRFITRRATAMHRLAFLKKIPERLQFKLFGDEGWKELLPQFAYCGKVDYGTELVDVYNASKINLALNNYGLVGLHSRVLDMALCKSFGLFEYTPGLAQHFTNKEDIVWFKTPEEMVELINYYLAHPEERQRIAENAYKNVIKNHTMEKRMKEMLDYILPEL